MLVAAFLRDMDYTNVNQTSFNIIYAMINAGLIALPFAAYETGIPLFVFLISFTSLLSAYTSVMVISMANEQKVRTLEDLAECAFGPRGFFAVCFFQILFSFSLMCISLDVYAEIMVDVFAGSVYAKEGFAEFILGSRLGEILLGSIVVLPLCILKTSMSSIRWTSYVTVFAVLAALTAVIATYLTDRSPDNTITSNSELQKVCAPKSRWWFTVLLCVFVFSCNQKMMTVFSSLRQRTVSRWRKAVRRAYMLLVLVYLLFGLFGYVAKERLDEHMSHVNFFVVSSGDHVRREIFDPARVAVAFSLLLTIPVDCLVAATTTRRFYSKYLKIYHPNQKNNFVTAWIEKCIERISMTSMSHHVDSGNEQTISNLRLTTLEAAASQPPPPLPMAPSVPIPIPSANVATGISGIDISQPPMGTPTASPSLNAPMSTPTRLTRKSKHLAAVARMRSMSASNSLSRSGASSYTSANPILSTKSRSERSSTIGTERKISEHTDESESDDEQVVVEEEGWNVYHQQALLSATHSTDEMKNDHILDGLELHNTRDNISVTRLESREENEVPEYGDLPIPEEKIEETLLNYLKQIFPAVTLYVLCVLTSLAITHWLYLAASVGTLSTAILLFVFPSILYFRLGLCADYQAIPIFRNVLPNQLYMHSIQIIGLAFILFDALLLFYFIYMGEHFVEAKS